MQIVEKLQVLPLPKRTESVTGDNKIPQHGVGSGNLHKLPQPAPTLVLLRTVISHQLVLYCNGSRSQLLSCCWSYSFPLRVSHVQEVHVLINFFFSLIFYYQVPDRDQMGGGNIFPPSHWYPALLQSLG